MIEEHTFWNTSKEHAAKVIQMPNLHFPEFQLFYYLESKI